MSAFRGWISGCALALVITASGAAHAADDQDVIDYRRHIMKTMGQQAAVIGMILQNRAPADDFATHVQILASSVATAKAAFEPKVPGGEAKPELWAQWPDFAKRLDTLTAATQELAKAAKEGGVAAAGPKVQDAFTCKSCHEQYREQKK